MTKERDYREAALGPPNRRPGSNGYDSYHPDRRDRDRERDRDYDRREERDRFDERDRGRNRQDRDRQDRDRPDRDRQDRARHDDRDSDHDRYSYRPQSDYYTPGRNGPTNTWDRSNLAPPPGLPPRPPANQPPPLPPGLPPPPPAGDSYRPGVAFTIPQGQGSFDFRVNAPATVQQGLQEQRQQEQNPRQERGGRRDRRDGRRQRGNDRRAFQQPRAAYRPRYASERELLSGAHANTPTEALFDEGAGITFRNPSDISDSDETDMDISDGSGSDSDSQQPRSKRARSKAVQSNTDADVPKWSNPDPYTALPPEGAAQVKKKDPVQMIRKARVQAKEARSSLPAQSEDFIPCDFDSSDESEAEIVSTVTDPAKTLGNVSSAFEAQFSKPLFNMPRIEPSSGPAIAPGSLPARTEPPSGPAIPTGPWADRFESPNGPAVSAQIEPPNGYAFAPDIFPVSTELPTYHPAVPGPYPAQPLPPPTADGYLGARKRTHNDRIKASMNFHKWRDINNRPTGEIVSEWTALSPKTAAPWFSPPPPMMTPMLALQKEVVDFYNYVRPRQFEEDVRNQCLADLNGVISRRFAGKKAALYPFGSFPSGLYLPTADMDMALLSEQFRKGGPANFNIKKTIYHLKEAIQRESRYEGDIECIVHARVPIIKFTHAQTKLKVDISVENSSGITALQTFDRWKRDYPLMPVLATMIKHFLAMRRLNDPAIGGIGGFSVICMVVSMLQHDPVIQSRARDMLHCAGEYLLKFFHYYGYQFNYKEVAIKLAPPELVSKNAGGKKGKNIYKNPDRLAIIDPNNEDNDISGGSLLYPKIHETFRQAHRDLVQRMNTMPKGSSILEVILGGDYSSFEVQRAHMEEVARRLAANRQS